MQSRSGFIVFRVGVDGFFQVVHTLVLLTQLDADFSKHPKGFAVLWAHLQQVVQFVDGFLVLGLVRIDASHDESAGWQLRMCFDPLFAYHHGLNEATHVEVGLS